jgi:hypothetical protein
MKYLILLLVLISCTKQERKRPCSVFLSESGYLCCNDIKITNKENCVVKKVNDTPVIMCKDLQENLGCYAVEENGLTTITCNGGTSVTFQDGKDGETVIGPKGDQGLTGDKGDKGDKGVVGEKGDTGEKGDKGDKGDTGEQGIQGVQGLKGDVGETGKNIKIHTLNLPVDRQLMPWLTNNFISSPIHGYVDLPFMFTINQIGGNLAGGGWLDFNIGSTTLCYQRISGTKRFELSYKKIQGSTSGCDEVNDVDNIVSPKVGVEILDVIQIIPREPKLNHIVVNFPIIVIGHY